MTFLVLTGCEIEDDGPSTEHVFVKVIDADLPESFEYGEIHEIEVTYLLPDACHLALGLQVQRGGLEPEKRREIYAAGVASRPVGLTECDREDGDLEVVTSFFLRINDNQPFTFYLWTGVDEDGKNTYTEIVVPVGESPTSTPAE